MVVVDFRFWGRGGGGFGAGFRTGDDRKADGDGIVIVSIVRQSCVKTWTMWLMGVSEHTVIHMKPPMIRCSRNIDLACRDEVERGDIDRL